MRTVILLVTFIALVSCRDKDETIKSLSESIRIFSGTQKQIDSIVNNHAMDSKTLYVVTDAVPAIPQNINPFTPEELAEISQFKPYVQDAAWFIKMYPEKMKMGNGVRWSGENFSFWVSNGKAWMEFENNYGKKLTPAERTYFWNLFAEYRDTKHRLHKWDNPNLKQTK